MPYVFYFQLAPLGVILGPLKSVLALFFSVSGDLFHKAKTHFFFFKKGHFPQQIWPKICVWNPKQLPDLNPRAGKWEISWPKNIVQGRGEELHFSKGPLFIYFIFASIHPYSGGGAYLEISTSGNMQGSKQVEIQQIDFSSF